jgi:hypothetical protein
MIAKKNACYMVQLGSTKLTKSTVMGNCIHDIVSLVVSKESHSIDVQKIRKPRLIVAGRNKRGGGVM